MRFSLCNEVLREWPFERQCAYAAALGYAGLEVAPFTLAEDPTRICEREAARLKQVAADHGLVVTGLHWLLVAPAGLSITDSDPSVAGRTRDAMLALVDLCAALGGSVLVHGSPAQRTLPEAGAEWACATALAHFAAAGAAAAKAGVTYCIEPLSPAETSFINTVAEAAALVDAAGTPGLATMLDTAAAAASEAEPAAAVLDRWLPTGRIAHIQLNDRNRRGPGQGDDRFAPVLAALQRHGWNRPVAIEPFVYLPDAPTTAAVSIAYLRGVLDGLEGRA
jgi:sugar phosphate isomerase/epimerase